MKISGPVRCRGCGHTFHFAQSLDADPGQAPRFCERCAVQERAKPAVGYEYPALLDGPTQGPHVAFVGEAPKPVMR